MRTLIRITLVCLFACAAAWAQSTAQIHGTIQDSTGAAVPGAEVKATQTATGVTRTTTSAADGGFVLTNLPLGPYRLEVSREGFTKAVESGIELQVNADPAVDVGKTLGRLGDAREDFQQRALARAVAADDADHLARPGLEGHVLERPQ